MKRLIKNFIILKTANLPTLQDNYSDIENYDFVDMGIKNINVDDIIGLSDSRVDEYNDDWTPKNKDDARWLKLYNGYKNEDNIVPIPLTETPDGKYFPSSDGNHRISVVKVLNLSTIPAKITKMVNKNKGIGSFWEEYAKDKIEELNKMSQKYQSMWPEFNELLDKSHNDKKYKPEFNNFKKVMEELSKKINVLDAELQNEEKNFKQNKLTEKLSNRLIQSYYDIDTRDAAITYIDGEILEGNTHANTISRYLNDHGWGQLNDQQHRPGLWDNYSDLLNKDIKDVELVKNNINSIAYAHRVDKKNGIFLDTSKLYNVDLNTVVSALKNKYKGYDIYDDNSYNYETLKFKQIAQKRLIKSEPYNGTKHNDNYYECYKNPTFKEWEITIENDNWANQVRGMLYKNGDLYIWPSHIIHQKAISNFNLPGDEIRLYITNEDVIGISLIPNIGLNEFKMGFSNSKSLYTYVSKNASLKFYSDYGIRPAYCEELENIQDILNIKEGDDQIEEIN